MTNLLTQDLTSPAPHAQPSHAEPSHELDGATVLVVGTGGIAAAVARHAVAAGASVTVAGRDETTVAAVAAGAGASGAGLDLADDASVDALARRLGAVDHVVNLAAAPVSAPLAALDRAGLVRAFDAKVFGPTLLAGRLAITTSLTLFAGFIAWRPTPGRVVMATANGAVSFLAQALAVELAPVRVNAISPGVVDSGSWDGLGDGKQAFLEQTARRLPARRTGTPDDLARAVLATMTNPFVTGTTLHVDGGARLA